MSKRPEIVRTVSSNPSRPSTAAPPKSLGRQPLSRRDWDRQAPNPTDSISVRNISVSATVGVDAWGRKRYQPVLISAKLSLAQSFDSAAQSDQVDRSTVHYGQLTKNIIEAVESRGKEEIRLDQLAWLIEAIASETAPFPALIATFETEIFLPKASLLGAGAGVKYAKAYGSGDESKVIFLRDVRVPAIIGVNSHERDSKQMVVANLGIDAVTRQDVTNRYVEMEQILVKVAEEFSFETLESLATKVASLLIKHIVFPMTPGAEVHLKLEKPSAIPFADAPAIEITRGSSQRDPFAMRLWDECEYKTAAWIPFPLKGRLSDWLEAQKKVAFRQSMPASPARTVDS
ncbi:MAG: hypothetical protein M1835_006496 [Candelina submexicana]|nr:MAG: hypothetical protein M1835_006496 [Candelina submexicana]